MFYDCFPIVDQTITPEKINALANMQIIVTISPNVASAGPVILSGSQPRLNTKKIMMMVIKVRIKADRIPAMTTIEIITIGFGLTPIKADVI